VGLPAAQQRVLDTIENALRASEPRLSAMYSIFTRLAKNDARPLREQLPFRRGWRCWLAGAGERLSAHRRLRNYQHRRYLVSRPPGGRRAQRRLLVLGQFVAVLALVGVLVGAAMTVPSGGCVPSVGLRSASAARRVALCGAETPARPLGQVPIAK
jgi:hypothetical protein